MVLQLSGVPTAIALSVSKIGSKGRFADLSQPTNYFKCSRIQDSELYARKRRRKNGSRPSLVLLYFDDSKANLYTLPDVK